MMQMVKICRRLLEKGCILHGKPLPKEGCLIELDGDEFCIYDYSSENIDLLIEWIRKREGKRQGKRGWVYRRGDKVKNHGIVGDGKVDNEKLKKRMRNLAKKEGKTSTISSGSYGCGKSGRGLYG